MNAERQYEVYEEGDSIIGCVKLDNPCNVRVEITEEFVRLFVGPRDWSWSRKTGLLNGCGTMISGEGLPDGE